MRQTEAARDAAGAESVLRSAGALPALPVVVSRLVELSGDPDATATRLSEVVALDPALLTSLLRLANSAYYGCSRTVSDLEAAIMLLGFDQVRDLALSLNVIAAVEPPEVSAFSTRDYWKHAFMVGSLSRALCRHFWRVYPGEHYVTGFLHDIGRLVMAQADPRAMREVAAAACAGRDPAARERELFGCDHAEVGALACRHWRLPERVAAAVAAHHGAGMGAQPSLGESELVQIVHVADVLTNHAGLAFTARRSRRRLVSPVRVALTRRAIALRRPALAKISARIASEVEATAQILALGKPRAGEE